MSPRLMLWLALSTTATTMVTDDQPYCALRYRRLCQGKGRHIACLFPTAGAGESCENYTEIKFTNDIRHFVTHYINRRRQRLAAGYERVRGGAHLPRPEVMMQVDWDRELATLAQRLADQCNFVHDDCRATVRYPYAGQTVGEVKWRRMSDSDELSAQRAVRRVLDAWWGERRRATPRQLVAPFRLTAKGTVWGHFSQLAVWTLRAVGCGAVRHGIGYPRVLLVCDFSHTNMLGQKTISPGPLAPCPMHTARRRRSPYPLLCAPVRHQAHTTTVEYQQGEGEYEYNAYEKEDTEFNTTLAPEAIESLSNRDNTRNIPMDITWRDSTTRQGKSWSNTERHKTWPGTTAPYTTWPEKTTWRETKTMLRETWPDTTKRRTTVREDTTWRETTWKNILSFKRTWTDIDSDAKTFALGLKNREHKDEEYDVLEESTRRSTRRSTKGRMLGQQELEARDEIEQAEDPHWRPQLLTRRPLYGLLWENEEKLWKSDMDSKPRKGWVPSMLADDDPKASRNWLPFRKTEDNEYNALGYYRPSKGPGGLRSNEPRQRWQQTRDRPRRPGANALLINAQATKTLRRRPEKFPNISPKMDKEIEDQLFLDTGFHPNRKPKKI